VIKTGEMGRVLTSGAVARTSASALGLQYLVAESLSLWERAGEREVSWLHIMPSPRPSPKREREKDITISL